MSFDSSDIGGRSLGSPNADCTGLYDATRGIIPCSTSWYYTLTIAWYNPVFFSNILLISLYNKNFITKCLERHNIIIVQESINRRSLPLPSLQTNIKCLYLETGNNNLVQNLRK